MGEIVESCHCDWGDKGPKAGACYNFTECSPCCGDPCNPADGVYCVLCFWCCGPCSGGKLYAHSLDQECAVVNHCLYNCFCGICAMTCIRHNLRAMYGVGEKDGAIPWFGDIVMTFFCGACTCCQELRSVDKTAWDWLPHVQEKGLTPMADECKFCRD